MVINDINEVHDTVDLDEGSSCEVLVVTVAVSKTVMRVGSFTHVAQARVSTAVQRGGDAVGGKEVRAFYGITVVRGCGPVAWDGRGFVWEEAVGALDTVTAERGGSLVVFRDSRQLVGEERIGHSPVGVSNDLAVRGGDLDDLFIVFFGADQALSIVILLVDNANYVVIVIGLDHRPFMREYATGDYPVGIDPFDTMCSDNFIIGIVAAYTDAGIIRSRCG